jgi:hypothetical protein
MSAENNKLIAVFMNWDSNESKTVYYEPTDEVQGIGGFTLQNLPFDNWNWLMEVVEKIENLEYINRMGRFNINAINFEENYTCVITDKENSFIQEEGERKISATYNACVVFIKWYNEQEKS